MEPSLQGIEKLRIFHSTIVEVEGCVRIMDSLSGLGWDLGRTGHGSNSRIRESKTLRDVLRDFLQATLGFTDVFKRGGVGYVRY